MKKWFNSFFLLDEEEEQDMQQTKQKEQPAAQPKQQPVKSVRERKISSAPQTSPQLVSIQNVQKSSKVILIEPRVYAEAQDISEHLKGKRAVIVNLQRIDKEQGIRIIDFLSGTVYALGGDIQRIGTDIFLCAPDTIEVDGAISDYYYDEHQ
ncbi:cell division protein SepF [Chryseomicrobium aureum]|uniref:cell division protein SepF n=1 Tax=Chryseomicrobium aureum TaxID=1441723 RepID=UPI00195F06EC|nr:cell division protein SepF [Chryseomicrobium aureum]MBM7705337.1 cell division inhibitor SepF [Chryseomicrobium aureum]